MPENLLGIDAPDGAEAHSRMGQIEEAQRSGFCVTLFGRGWSGCLDQVDAVVLGGVMIGNGVVVAAGWVVTKDVETSTVVAGFPAKFGRRRPSSRRENSE
jgi:hypothetical protein